jgi:methionyl-tRNA formyltransferase
MNVIEWAVLEGVAPVLSIHFVDTGVDTGDIIVTEPVPLYPGDSLDTVRRRASTQQVELLARTVHAALTGPLPRYQQRPEEGRQYFVMHPQLRAVAEQRLRQYVASLSKV